MIKEKYKEFYAPLGLYRRYVLKHLVNETKFLECILKLDVKLNRLVTLPELQNTTLRNTLEAFAEDYKEVKEELLACKDINTRADKYDILASVLEGLNTAVAGYLAGKKAFSEDAQMIQRQTHLQKDNPLLNKTKSLAAKQSWIRNKDKIKSGIQAFHKSTQGKLFHRNLARFNAISKESKDFSMNDILITCKGISSLQTHVIIEIQNMLDRKVESNISEITKNIESLKILYDIFGNVNTALFESFFTNDYDIAGDMLSIVSDYYIIANEEI